MVDEIIRYIATEAASIDLLVLDAIQGLVTLAAVTIPAYTAANIVWRPLTGKWLPHTKEMFYATLFETGLIAAYYYTFFMPDMNNSGLRDIGDFMLVGESIGSSIKEAWYSFLHY